MHDIHTHPHSPPDQSLQHIPAHELRPYTKQFHITMLRQNIHRTLEFDGNEISDDEIRRPALALCDMAEQEIILPVLDLDNDTTLAEKWDTPTPPMSPRVGNNVENNDVWVQVVTKNTASCTLAFETQDIAGRSQIVPLPRTNNRYVCSVHVNPQLRVEFESERELSVDTLLTETSTRVTAFPRGTPVRVHIHDLGPWNKPFLVFDWA